MSDNIFQRSVIAAASPGSVGPLIAHGDALFRLNPEWEVLQFADNTLRVRYERSEAEAEYGVVMSLQPDGGADIDLVGASPRRIEFSWEPAAAGVQIQYREDFGEVPIAARVAELHMWLQAFAGYLALTARTTRRARALRWLVDHVWLRMSPTSRRVSLLIVGMEFLALLLLIAVLLVQRWWG